MVTRDSVPALRRGIRRHFDATRKAHVLLGPERVIVLDEIAFAITECFDAQRTVSEISGMLATRFESDAAVVEPDVLAFVAELVEKGLAVA